ncbi:Cell division control protein 7 [Coemansia sp. RSA 637]|nr:Cell division control protein 7 [Coemansia sp. RSA 637]
MYWESVGKRMRDVPPSYSYKYTQRRNPELFTAQGIPVVQSSKRVKLTRPKVTAQRNGVVVLDNKLGEAGKQHRVMADSKVDEAVKEHNAVADSRLEEAVKELQPTLGAESDGVSQEPSITINAELDEAVKELEPTLNAELYESVKELEPTLNAEPGETEAEPNITLNAELDEAVREPSITLNAEPYESVKELEPTLYNEPVETETEPNITLNAELDEAVREPSITLNAEPYESVKELEPTLYNEPVETETEPNITLYNEPDETEDEPKETLNAEPDTNNQEQTDNGDVNEPSDQNHVQDQDDNDVTEEHIDGEDQDDQYEDQQEHNSDDDGFSDDGSCEETQEEMQELEDLIPGLSEQYRLLGKIGEGTFSTVYKALDLQHERFDNNGWTMIFDGGATRRARVVAIKKIYVTSSPARIANEISILSDLRGSRFIAPLVTAMRREDQVVVVLPYFRNDDFRRFYMDMPVCEMRWYMASLVGALAHAHERGIMHRDIKPSNFLYDVRRRHGVLVDFGLAERENDQEATRARRALQMDASTATRLFRSFDARGRPGVPRKDTRPGLRANRAGTRGFRAPEVLLKVARQAVAIDMWSVGVILLCLLTRRFPFFQSTDDTEALLEIAVLFGRLEMERAVAELGRTFLTNVPTVKDRAIRFESLAKAYNAEGFADLPPDVFDLLRKLLTLSPATRITAAEALQHPFIANRE